MKITREQRELGTSILKVVVGEQDYGEAVEKMLRDYKRKANIPGFRPGMVPMGVVRKMYGKGAVAEQSYRVASNSVFEYLQKEGIDYVGDVIPSDEQGDFDFENNTEHEFIFEIGEAPKVEVELSAKDKLTYNKIKVDKKMLAAYKDNYLRRYGRLVDVEKVKKDEALTVVLDNGDIQVDDAYVGLISMSDEERKPFIGKKVGAKMEVDVNELYKTASQRAAILKVKEEELESINPKFSLEIKQIRQFANPELNEEFFKMAFPAGNITSEEELDAFLSAEVDTELSREADYLFANTVRKFLVEKAALQMPTEFLKRWLYVINEGKFTKEDIEKDFDGFVQMFTWNYLQKHFIQAADLKVAQEEVEAEAKEFAKAQFAQYGMPSAPEEMIANFSKQILENKEQAQKIYEKLYEMKVVEYVKSQVKVTTKAVSSEDFAKLAQEA
ncbi:MAG: trigger factor [Alistipes sp.]|nr:trigger factor [Alistipes sp.]MBR6662920.1 trigger factor [Alistipes sp.]MBR7096939.1 trigger factor [Alistipes sp.]